MGLAVLFGVPLAAMVTLVFRRDGESEGDGDLQAIAVYSLALIVVLLMVVAYFTTSVIGEGPYESLARLHMRYYDFLFPLFFIVVAGQVSIKDRRRNSYVAGISVAVLVGLFSTHRNRSFICIRPASSIVRNCTELLREE